MLLGRGRDEELLGRARALTLLPYCLTGTLLVAPQRWKDTPAHARSLRMEVCGPVRLHKNPDLWACRSIGEEREQRWNQGESSAAGTRTLSWRERLSCARKPLLRCTLGA